MQRTVVITGIGLVTPIGVGETEFWQALTSGTSGIAAIERFDASGLPLQIAGEVRNCDLKKFVRPRKSLKIMSRDSQLAVAAAVQAFEASRLQYSGIEPERLGVILGADRNRLPLEEIADCYRDSMVDGRFNPQKWVTEGIYRTSPLTFLKTLPNMVSAHVSIALDARGPNNTTHQAEISGLLAMQEAAAAIQTGKADVMLAGSAAARLHPLDLLRASLYQECSRWNDRPAEASRPFDLQRSGQVLGEGAAVFVLEELHHAYARHAPLYAQLLGSGLSCLPPQPKASIGPEPLRGALRRALQDSGLTPAEIGHINADGMSTRCDDEAEAAALQSLLPEVPVLAPKSYFGNLAAGCGGLELAASVLACSAGLVPPTLNYEFPDPHCPLNVIAPRPLRLGPHAAVSVNQTRQGQAAALVIGPAG